jgi:hypothetical protein
VFKQKMFIIGFYVIATFTTNDKYYFSVYQKITKTSVTYDLPE